MKIFPRTHFGNPILRQKAKKVSLSFLKTREFKRLISQMFYTMKRANGVGLAAPQIGISLQLAVIQVKPTKLRPNLPTLPKTVIVNPEIISHSKEMVSDWEGCLSFPGVRGEVSRYKKIKVRYTNEQGETITHEHEGFIARVFQHEIDHLNGTVYVDRMEDMKTLMVLKEFKKRILKLK